MKYRLDAKYCWYNEGTMIVLMYFLNQVPFTFDELPDGHLYDLDLIQLADNERRFEPEDLFKGSGYLIMEEAHPCFFEIEIENLNCFPDLTQLCSDE